MTNTTIYGILVIAVIGAIVATIIFAPSQTGLAVPIYITLLAALVGLLQSTQAVAATQEQAVKSDTHTAQLANLQSTTNSQTYLLRDLQAKATDIHETLTADKQPSDSGTLPIDPGTPLPPPGPPPYTSYGS